MLSPMATVRQAEAAVAEVRKCSAAPDQAPRDIPSPALAKPGSPVPTPCILVTRPPREDEATRGRTCCHNVAAAAAAIRSSNPRVRVQPNHHLQDNEQPNREEILHQKDAIGVVPQVKDELDPRRVSGAAVSKEAAAILHPETVHRAKDQKEDAPPDMHVTGALAEVAAAAAAVAVTAAVTDEELAF